MQKGIAEKEIIKYRNNNKEVTTDFLAIEEPLEISIKFKTKETWTQNIISITMRTPGNDEDLVRGFLFNEKIIEKNEYIEKIESVGEYVGEYKLQNKIVVTLNNSENIDIDKIKRNFLTNSSRLYEENLAMIQNRYQMGSSHPYQ